jgi:hypothetical protein
MGQDPIEYGTHTWHTNLDTYERILEDDVKKDAVEIAWAVYQLAMRDDLLPRFAKESMPPRPPVDAATQPQPTTTAKPKSQPKAEPKLRPTPKTRRRSRVQ